MAGKLSSRLREIVEALPLKPGMRVLEIGCGTGAMAREIVRRIGNGHVLGVDRSDKAIAQARSGSAEAIAAGHLAFHVSGAETFVLAPGEQPYDIAVAIRVGALDGRDAEAGALARAAIKAALVPGGKLYIDGGNPLREVDLN